MDDVTMSSGAYDKIWGTGGVKLDPAERIGLVGLTDAVERAGYRGAWGKVDLAALTEALLAVRIENGTYGATIADLDRGAAQALADHLIQRGTAHASDSPLEPAYLEKLISA